MSGSIFLAAIEILDKFSETTSRKLLSQVT
jgi:hypothetical protein